MMEQFGLVNHPLSPGDILALCLQSESLLQKSYVFFSFPNNVTGSNAEQEFGLIIVDVRITGVLTLTLKEGVSAWLEVVATDSVRHWLAKRSVSWLAPH